MKQILIRPPWKPWLKNRMFTGAKGCIYVRAFSLLRQHALENGFQLDTWDMHPLSKADCIWMMDLPPRRKIYQNSRIEAQGGIPFVLQTLESPLLGPQNFIEYNRKHFDVVVSFETNFADSENYFSYHLPNTLTIISDSLLYSERKCAVMLNSNRVEGYLAMRQLGAEGLPGIGRFFNGWKLPVSKLVSTTQNELYTWRRMLGKTADKLGGDILEIYGYGWAGQQISWFPGYHNPIYHCANKRKIITSEKQQLFSNYRFGIATENYFGELGYISEKIFDALMAGTVPVYLGEKNITKYVPSECFVNASQFGSHQDLLCYLRDCPEYEWMQMRDAGQNYLNSKDMQPFTDEYYANQMVSFFKHIL